MRALIFQHTKDEIPGTLTDWLEARKHPFHLHHWYLGEPVPDPEEFDSLFVLGGTMNVDDEDAFPWLSEEKAFLRHWIASGKPYLGLCLGGQLLAQALGAPVKRSELREIGFWPVSRTGAEHPALRRWPETTPVYQFHQDRFDLPPGCVSLLTSPGCPHQAFARGPQVLGLQFHPESTADWIAGNAGSVQRREGEPYVQSPEETAAGVPRLLEPLRANFFALLDDLFA